MRFLSTELAIFLLLNAMDSSADSCLTLLKYHPGFGSEISTEALPGALPKGQVCLDSVVCINYILAKKNRGLMQLQVGAPNSFCLEFQFL